MRANITIVRGIAASMSILTTSISIFSPLVQGFPCNDFSDWKDDNRGEGCDFVSEKPNKYRCKKWGTTQSGDRIRANVACKKSCQTCSCKDSDTWVYEYKNELKGCDFVSKRKKRCNRKGVNGTKAKKECHISCNTCKSETAPTSSPSKSPTKTHTQVPTIPTDDRSTGQLCTNKSQCLSGVCQRGTCYASDECSAIKQQEGVAFDSKMIVLVFVGSGFVSQEDWQQQVIKTFSVFRQYEMLNNGVQAFNAFYVDVLEDSFCNFGCYGIDRLLCCNVMKAKTLARKCFYAQANLQTIVIHNDSKYGGAGYSFDNVATTSIHPYAGKVAVHELGHSLFELADEYTSGWGTASNANCDVAGCPKWSDLSDHIGTNLCTRGACQGGKYYSASSFMWYLNSPVGEVNSRFTCCTYIALTKKIPSYCDKFEFGEGLLSYCKRDYQGYGDIYETVNIGREPGDEEYLFRVKYVSVVRPMVILINVEDNTFTCLEKHDIGSKPYRRRQVFGDYHNSIAAKNAGATEVLEVTITFGSGLKQEMMFNPSLEIHVPPGEDKLVTRALANYAPSDLEIVVDGGKGQVIHVNVDLKHVDTVLS